MSRSPGSGVTGDEATSTLFLLAEKETAKAVWKVLKTMHLGADHRKAKARDVEKMCRRPESSSCVTQVEVVTNLKSEYELGKS